MRVRHVRLVGHIAVKVPTIIRPPRRPRGHHLIIRLEPLGQPRPVHIIFLHILLTDQLLIQVRLLVALDTHATTLQNPYYLRL